MSNVTIRIKPRHVERAVFILVILILLVYVAALSVKNYSCNVCEEGAEAAAPVLAEQVVVEEPVKELAPVVEKESEVVEEDPIVEEKEPVKNELKPKLSGILEFEVINLNAKGYERRGRDGNMYEYGQDVSFKLTIENGKAEAIEPKADLYFYHNGQDDLKDMVQKQFKLPLIKPGERISKEYELGNDIMFSDMDETYNFVIKFYDRDDRLLKTLSKKLTPSDVI